MGKILGNSPPKRFNDTCYEKKLGVDVMKFLVTGVTGFIGSYFAKYVIKNYPDIIVVGVTRNTSQKHFMRISEILNHPRFQLYFADFAKDDLGEVMEDVDYVFHFGAKTFVDHSIRDPAPFIESNIVGTYRILEAERVNAKKLKMHFQISTDEVYGQILEGAYKEDARLNPRNPYAATKAAADMLSLSYYNTYGLPVIITRTENNYGPYQHPQKAIPTFVRCALENKPLPVYGDGKHSRMWLHVEDHVRGLLHLISYGKAGEIYHIAGEQELQNIELAKRVLRILDKPEDMIQFVPDYNIRPGHDRRYALNTEKIRATGWKPLIPLDVGLKETVLWYKNHPEWLQ
jgi:dTDP-glucose 4,6-dehydratase